MHSLTKKVIRRIQELAQIDVRALAAMRIMLGATILVDLANRAQFLAAHYTEQGVIPRSLLLEDSLFWPFSLHLLNGSVPFQALLFLVSGAFAFMLLVGWKTKLASIASWFLLLSLHAANPYNIHGADMELRLVMFFSMFLPLGAAWAFDAKERRKNTLVASLGSAAFLLQMGFMYFFAALNKTGEEWRDGTTAWFAFSSEHYAHPYGTFMLNYPELLTVLTFSVIAIQSSSLFLIFFPFFNQVTRTTSACLLIGMQVVFLLFLRIGLFPFVSIAALLPLLPSVFWDWLEKCFRVKKHQTP